MPEDKHFDYFPEVSVGGEINAPVHYRIKRVTNLIPVEVEYEEDGKPQVLTTYVDYFRQEIKLTGVCLEDAELFKNNFFDYLKRGQHQYVADTPDPDLMARIAGHRESLGEKGR